jgi:hypothetical protein
VTGGVPAQLDSCTSDRGSDAQFVPFPRPTVMRVHCTESRETFVGSSVAFPVLRAGWRRRTTVNR